MLTSRQSVRSSAQTTHVAAQLPTCSPRVEESPDHHPRCIEECRRDMSETVKPSEGGIRGRLQRSQDMKTNTNGCKGCKGFGTATRAEPKETNGEQRPSSRRRPLRSLGLLLGLRDATSSSWEKQANHTVNYTTLVPGNHHQTSFNGRYRGLPAMVAVGTSLTDRVRNCAYHRRGRSTQLYTGYKKFH